MLTVGRLRLCTYSRGVSQQRLHAPSNLSPQVQATLVRSPAPHAHAYAVVPQAPPRAGVAVTSVVYKHLAADRAMADVDAYAQTLHDP